MTWQLCRYQLQQLFMKFQHYMNQMLKICVIVFRLWQGWRKKMFNQEPPIQTEKQTELEVIFGEKQRLHPAAILFNLLYALKEMIFGLGIGFVISLRESVFYFFVFITIFIIFLVVSSFLSWLRFTYYIKDGELRVEQGVFIRK